MESLLQKKVSAGVGFGTALGSLHNFGSRLEGNDLCRPSSTAAASAQTVQVLAAAALWSVRRCGQARARLLKLRALAFPVKGLIEVVK